MTSRSSRAEILVCLIELIWLPSKNSVVDSKEVWLNPLEFSDLPAARQSQGRALSKCVGMTVLTP